LGGKELILLSAEHGTGITDLIEKIQEVTPTQKVVETQDISFAFVGKPNVGKSSLLNQLLKEERSLVHHKPGTTRDVIDGRITFFEKKINILDTAGIRRHAKTEGVLEYLGMKKLKF
jgi:GTP-binding protein